MSETSLYNVIRLAVCKLGARLFRNNTALAWVGKVVRRDDRTITLENYRPLHAGLEVGGSDLVGWTPVTITADMVGKTVALFTAFEVKAVNGRTSKEQENFLRAIVASGGVAGVVRSDTQAVALVERAQRGQWGD